MPDRSGPLAGVRVLDFTHIYSGPFCTQFLADAGATVVKVEPPGGEYGRIRGPRRIGGDGAELSSYYAAMNRGKRSIVIDLKNPHGFELIQRFIETTDIIVENFAPGVVARLGLDFAELRAKYPTLITASISLYGNTESAGALSARGGLAVVAECESGLTSMTRDKRGVPIPLGFPLGDTATGLAGYAAIMTALYERSTTGRGRHLDISMVHTLFVLNSGAVTAAQIAEGDRFVQRTAVYGIFPTTDGYVTLAVNSDSLFKRLATAMGQPELADDPRFAGYAARDLPHNADAAEEIVAQWTSAHSTDEVIATIAPTGVPCGKVVSPRDVMQNEELRRMGFVEVVKDGLGNTIDTAASPLGYHLDSYEIPTLAGNARELLAEIGVTDAEYSELTLNGALGPSI